MTAGNVHDSRERDTLLLGDEDALYADAAYSSAGTRKKLKRLGIRDRVQRKGYRDHPISEADKARNAEIAVTRSYLNLGESVLLPPINADMASPGHALWGLSKNLTFYGLAALASNIKKAAKFLILYGLPDPVATG